MEAASAWREVDGSKQKKLGENKAREAMMKGFGVSLLVESPAEHEAWVKKIAKAVGLAKLEETRGVLTLSGNTVDKFESLFQMIASGTVVPKAGLPVKA